MRYLSKEKRTALSQRLPREEVKCPVCEAKAERTRNGDWYCIDVKKVAFDTYFLTCGARGVTVNGELVPTSVIYQLPKVDDEDSSVQESS